MTKFIETDGKIELISNGNNTFWTRVVGKPRSQEFAGRTLKDALISFKLRIERGY